MCNDILVFISKIYTLNLKPIQVRLLQWISTIFFLIIVFIFKTFTIEIMIIFLIVNILMIPIVVDVSLKDGMYNYERISLCIGIVFAIMGVIFLFSIK